MDAGHSTSGWSKEECLHFPCAGENTRLDFNFVLLFTFVCVSELVFYTKFMFLVQAGIVKKENIKIHGF